MTHIETALPYVLATLTAGAVLAYVLMDGWDLGVGILLPLIARRADTTIMFESIAPFWDANEILLLVGGLTLIMGLPVAYAMLLPHVYTPLAILFVSFGLRGLGYELNDRGGPFPRFCLWAFAVGSIVAALSQGWLAGLLVEGIAPAGTRSIYETIGRQLYPAICAVALLGGYALLGCCWLIFKTQDTVQVFGREVGFSALLFTAAWLVITCAWTPFASPGIARRWLATSPLPVLSVLPVVAIFFGWKLRRSLWAPRKARPLVWASLLIVAAFGIAVSLFPVIVPFASTMLAAADKGTSLDLAALGLIVVFALMILYLLLVYRLVRGKLSPLVAKPPLGPHVGSQRTSGRDRELHLS
jgi:cytochrome bd ubiquinol oxidase subunit II